MFVSIRDITEVGTVKHFFSKISVAIVDLSGKLSIGDKLLIRGLTTDFEMILDSMQIDHVNVVCAESGQVAIKSKGQVKEQDKIYKKR
jgi:hypothetical protein